MTPHRLRKLMLNNARHRAEYKELPFSITLDDIVIPEICPVLGIPLHYNGGRQGGGFNSPTLDRIINDKGYVPGNVRVVSKRYNNLKSNATTEELKLVALFALRDMVEHETD